MQKRAEFARVSIVVLAMALLGFSETALAVTTPFQCFANGGVSSPARGEGLAELVGDLILNCTGGIPTPVGSPIPTVSIQIFLNTSLTSRLLANPWLEALLLINEPTPLAQQLGTNVFQGSQTTSNSVTFSAVPINPPGAGTLTLRITNIRANANALGLAPPNTTPTAIVETVSSTLPVSNPSQTVAFSQQGAAASLSSAPSFSQCSSQNQALADDPTQSGAAQFNVTFFEQFATAFKQRNTATSAGAPNALADQNNLSVFYNTETGFYNNS
jgi:hypothetical protein